MLYKAFHVFLIYFTKVISRRYVSDSAMLNFLPFSISTNHNVEVDISVFLKQTSKS